MFKKHANMECNGCTNSGNVIDVSPVSNKPDHNPNLSFHTRHNCPALPIVHNNLSVDMQNAPFYMSPNRCYW